jgi:hypothetical protein
MFARCISIPFKIKIVLNHIILALCKIKHCFPNAPEIKVYKSCEKSSYILKYVQCQQIVHNLLITFYARILKAHSHSMSGGSIWASLECECGFWIAGGWVVT